MWLAVDAVLSASVPRTEIVGKGDYFRFSMRDCLALEASFLEVTTLNADYLLLNVYSQDHISCSDLAIASCNATAFEIQFS